MIKLLSKNRFWILLFFLFIILRLPSLFEPYWYGDEGIYLVLGQAVRRGLTLYRQMHDNKPPTLYYLAAFSQTVFGFRLLLLAFMLPTIIFYYRLARKFFTPKISKISTLIFTLLSSIPLIEGTIANAEVFMLLPTILAVLLILSSTQKIAYLFAGLLLGLAFTIKVPVAIEFALLTLWLGLRETNFSLKNLKNKIFPSIISLLIFSLAFFLPIFVQFIYYSTKGASFDFLFAALLQNFGYLSSWSTGTHSASALSGGLSTRFIITVFSWLLLFLFHLFKFIDKKALFVYLWFSAALFGSLLSGRPYPHYLIQLLPPFCMVLAFFFQSKRNQFKTFSLISLFILAVVIIKYEFYFYPTITYYTNFYSYITGRKSLEAYRRFFGPRVNTTYAIANFIKSNTSSQDKIFVWGDEPYIYALSQRLPPGKFTVAYHVVDFGGHQSTIDSFKVSQPAYIVYFPMSNRPFPDLDKFILKYYSLDQIIDSAYIFKKR
ncbi:MAG: glycosyltransferase family 39 protein [Patescibacteria group bacterium]|jgi:hypothetical protein